MDIEEIRRNVRGILGLEAIKEVEEDDPQADDDLDIDIDDAADDEDADIDINNDEDDSQDTETDTSDENDQATGDDGEDGSSDDEDASDEPVANETKKDSEKVEEMFSDTGDIYEDYSLANDANQRMAKFRFTYAGIDVDTLMTDSERTLGVSADELYARLAPDQQEESLRKWKKLRYKFPEIANRERFILIHNANIMLFINNDEGRQTELPENLRKKAYEKIDAMMKKRYGEEWQDSSEAINFLTSIKINFSEENPVKPSLLSLESFTSLVEAGKIPFNRMFVEAPASVKTFLRNNQENDFYNRSPIFQALISDYREDDSVTGTLSPIVKGSPPEIEEDIDIDADGEDDGGGGVGGGDLGGGGTDVDVDVDTDEDDPIDIGPGGDADDDVDVDVETDEDDSDFEL